MNTLNKSNPVYNLKEQLKLFFSISLGIYLFILFFQPFGNVRPDIDEKLLYNAGLAGISYFMMWIFRIMIPSTYPKFSNYEKWNIGSKTMIYALIWFFNTLAFYLILKKRLKLSKFSLQKTNLKSSSFQLMIWF